MPTSDLLKLRKFECQVDLLEIAKKEAGVLAGSMDQSKPTRTLERNPSGYANLNPFGMNICGLILWAVHVPTYFFRPRSTISSSTVTSEPSPVTSYTQKCPPNEGTNLLTPHFTARLFLFQECISIYTFPLLFLLANNISTGHQSQNICQTETSDVGENLMSTESEISNW